MCLLARGHQELSVFCHFVETSMMPYVAFVHFHILFYARRKHLLLLWQSTPRIYEFKGLTVLGDFFYSLFGQRVMSQMKWKLWWSSVCLLSGAEEAKFKALSLKISCQEENYKSVHVWMFYACMKAAFSLAVTHICLQLQIKLPWPWEQQWVEINDDCEESCRLLWYQQVTPFTLCVSQHSCNSFVQNWPIIRIT